MYSIWSQEPRRQHAKCATAKILLCQYKAAAEAAEAAAVATKSASFRFEAKKHTEMLLFLVNKPIVCIRLAYIPWCCCFVVLKF